MEMKALAWIVILAVSSAKAQTAKEQSQQKHPNYLSLFGKREPAVIAALGKPNSSQVVSGDKRLNYRVVGFDSFSVNFRKGKVDLIRADAKKQMSPETCLVNFGLTPSQWKQADPTTYTYKRFELTAEWVPDLKKTFTNIRMK